MRYQSWRRLKWRSFFSFKDHIGPCNRVQSNWTWNKALNLSTHSNLATTHVFPMSLSHTCGWRLVPWTIWHVFGIYTKSFASIQMVGILASFWRSALGFYLMPPLSLSLSLLVSQSRWRSARHAIPLNGSFRLDSLTYLTTCPCFLFCVLVRSPARSPPSTNSFSGSEVMVMCLPSCHAWKSIS